VAALFSAQAAALEPLPAPKADTENRVVFTIDDPNYAIGGQTKQADTAPYIKNGRVMLPIRYVAEALGIDEGKIEWDPAEQRVTIFHGNSIIQMKIGEPTLSVDGRAIQMDAAPEIRDGRTMIPLRAVAEALGVELKWNSYSRSVSFELPESAKVKLSEQKQEEASETSANVSEQKQDKKSMAASANKEVYTYDELVTLALENSKELQKNKYQMDRTEILREEAVNQKDYVPFGISYGAAAAAASQIIGAIKSADIQMQVLKDQRTITEDAIAYQVLEAYYEIIKAEEKLAVLEKSLAVQKKTLEQAEKKYEVGMISQLERDKERKNYEESKKNKAILEEQRENAYEKLNHLVGFDVKKRYSLSNDLAFRPIKDISLDAHIQRIITDSPPIRILEQNVNLNDLGLKLYVYNAGMDPYDVKEIDLKTSKLTLADAKDQYAQSLRNLYSSLKQLEEKHETLQINLDKALNDLKLAKANLAVDMITQLDFEKANLQVESLKQQMRENIMQYETLKMVYEKPWAMQQSS
ncbi:MAG TPA: TolC family protein, partial [Clostridiales bacterium]|nr:TolC family protein [Clostridiales bacterium]